MRCNKFGELETDLKKSHGTYMGPLWRDANFQTVKSLKNELVTFRDELESLFDTFRRIYGPLPWDKQAKRFNDGDFSSIERIEAKRKVDLKVN